MINDKKKQGKSKVWFVLVGILLIGSLIGFTSAEVFTFDNKVTYSEDLKTVLIKNRLDLIGSNDLAEIKLISPLYQELPRGYQEVARFNVTGYIDYNDFISQITLEDMKDNKKEFLRDYNLKYSYWEQVLIQDYEWVVTGYSENGTSEIKEYQNIGSHYETKEFYTTLNSIDLKKNENLIITLWIEVKKGDYVDWKPTFAGKKINEWAIWTESMEVDIITYYTYDGNFGIDQEDDFYAVYNLTNNGATNTTGKIGSAYNFINSETDWMESSASRANDNERTFSSWIKLSSDIINSGTDNPVIVARGNNSQDMRGDEMAMVTLSGNNALCYASRSGIYSCDSSGTINITSGVWHYLAVTFKDDTNDLRFFVDGVNTANASYSTSPNTNFLKVIVGAEGHYTDTRRKFNGVIDEVGIWSRILTYSEISDLYNDGSGIQPPISSGASDTTPPTYSDNQTNQTLVGKSTVFAIKYDDDTALETDGGYIFSTNNTGTWVNESLVMWTSTPEWANVTKILNDTVSVIVGYRWYANDSAGNVNNTELFSVITTDITPPLITIIYPTATTYSENVSNLNYTYIELYPDSCWYSTNGGTTNSSLVNVGTNFTDVISVGGSNTWFLYCNDTSDNLNVSSITFDVNVLWYNTGYPFTNKSFRITEFINVSGTNFTLGGEPYKLIGANFYYAIDYMTNHTYTDNGEELNGSEEDVYEVLNEMQYLGINVVRTWGTMMGGNSGETNATWEVDTIGGHYNLGEVYYPGNYNETFFKAFDKFLYEASKRDIRTQIVLINNWEAYGGMQWYLSHSTTSDKTYEDALYLSDNWWTWHDQFYTDADANIYFQNTINYILNRNNTYTGILYKDDPTIFSWMIANEPRAKTGNHSVIANWCNDIATYIKSIDSNHLVTCGIESLGFNETWGEGANMITTYNNTASDYITFAMNTGQWGYMVGLAETSNDGVYMCLPDGSNCGIGNANVRAFWAYGHNYTYNSYWHSNLPWWIPELARHGYDNWVTQNVKWANEIGKPVMLQELVVDQSYSDATKDNVYLNAISNFYSNGGDGIMLWTMNSDSYYRNSDTSSTGNQDDGYGFYLSDNSTLKTLSASSINAIQNATDYTTSLNSYKYNFVLNIGFASDTMIDNCTLFLNVSNGTDWTDYYADQSNTSAIIYDDDYTFTTQFDSDDEEFYWYTECYGDSTTITSDVNHVQVKSATPIINLVSPGNNTSYNTDALDFFYNVINTIDISFCELYIDEELNKTDYSVSLDINQSFSVSDFSDATHNWSVKCTDTDSNEGFSETRTFIIDATPPYFITIPNNESIFYLNETLSVTFVGTDETGFSHYYINDTTNFAINQTGFLINNTPLSAGNYFVNVTINDTLNNINWTIFTLEVNQSLYSCDIILNDTSPLTFHETLLIHTNCSSAYTMKLNGTTISNDSVLDSGVGGFNISVERTDAINYSNIYDEEIVSVLQNADNCQVAFNETSPITFPETFTSFTDCSSAYTLYLNGSAVTNNSVVNYGANYFNFSVQRTDIQNYSNIYDDEYFTVSQSSDTCEVAFNETSPISFPGQFQAFSSCESVSTLTLNGTTISNDSAIISGAGYWNISVLRTDATNYTNYFDDEWFNVSKAILSGSLTNNETWTEIYPTSVTIGLSESNAQDGDVTYIVWRDDISKATGESVLLGVTTYDYILNTSGGTNYSSASLDTETLTINPSSDDCEVFFNATSPIVYLETFIVWHSCDSTSVLTQNGTTITNNSEVNYGVGGYNYSVLRTDATNYSNYFDDEIFSVLKNGGNCQVLFNETSPHTNNTAFTSYTDCTTGFQMYRNGSILGNNSQQYPLNAGTYNYSVFRNDTLNYSNYFDDEWFIVSIPPQPIPPVPSPYDDLTKSIAQILQALIVLAAAIIIMFLVRSLYRDERTLAEVIKVGLLVGLFTFILILLMPIMVSYIADLIN